MSVDGSQLIPEGNIGIMETGFEISWVNIYMSLPLTPYTPAKQRNDIPGMH